MPQVSLDERLLEYKELVAAKAELALDDLIFRLRDGRAIVRANAALGLAALGHSGPELIPFLRDGDARAALAAAEALAHLGVAQKAHLVQIATALDGARPEVVDTVQRMFSELVGKADAELATVLDTASTVSASALVAACTRVGVRGLHLLQTAARDERARVRINAVRGISQLGDIEQESSMDVLNAVEKDDKVSDVRAAARAAVGALTVRCRAILSARRKSAEPAPPAVPELELREMTAAELEAAAKLAPVDELLRALADVRVHARQNALRILALKGPAAAGCARSVAVLLRDREDTIRVDAAQALGKLGPAAADASPALVAALGDEVAAVCAAAEGALAAFGDTAGGALVEGLGAESEAHGARVAALLGKLPDGPRLLRDAVASTSIDVRINAALGLGALGKARAGAAMQAIAAAMALASGNARLRGALAKAAALLEPKLVRTPTKIAIEGFEDRVLTEEALAKGKAALDKAGAAGLAQHLTDARPAVRANAALALATLGPDALPVAGAIAVGLRDDAPEVKLAAARALDKAGDPAVGAAAHDLVRALRDADDALAAQIATILTSRNMPAIDEALGRGLDTADARHGERVCELVIARASGPDLLYDAFMRATGQINAAHGFVKLGKDRLGRGRALLESARASGSVKARELARNALRVLDGAPAAPELPAIAGFETKILDAAAFANGKLDPARLVPFLVDGRGVVRANTATALGSLGAAAAGFASTVASLMRDDDDRVRIAAAGALDRLGDDAVIAGASYLVGALRGNEPVAAAVTAVLAPRKGKVEAALVAGLETHDEAHGLRVAELICALPNAKELLFAAFDGPAQNVQMNAALGIGLLGAKAAGPAGRRRLQSGLAGPFTRRREAMVKALALLDRS